MPSPTSADLRPLLDQWGLEPRRQGERPTCSVFAVVGALEYAVARRQGQGTRLSVEFLNWAAHRAVNRSADGGFFTELWEGYSVYGICPEASLPYRSAYDVELEPADEMLARARATQGLGLGLRWIKEWDPTTGLDEAQLDQIRHTLAGGWPVRGGLRWPRQPRWEQDLLRMCPAGEVYDGHSVLLVGYRDDPGLPGGGTFLIRNSGGEGRDGWLSYEYVRAYTNDAAVIEPGE